MAIGPDVLRRAVTASFVLALAFAAAGANEADADEIDSVKSHFGFKLQTRWGKSFAGRFPRAQGTVSSLPDGRRQVRLQLDTRAVEMVGSKRYSEFSRSEKFFDAARFPSIDFVSDPYPDALLHKGGDLSGKLTLRGITRREVFVVAPATCAQPLHECDVVARGSVRREDYGMDAYGYLLRGSVRFNLNVRVRPQDET
ncbi:MAG: YceI family protein [Luteimonas sp.]